MTLHNPMNPRDYSRLRNWQIVKGAYTAAGIVGDLTRYNTPSGYAYDNGVAALTGDEPEGYALGLHDLCHWLIAPKSRKNLPNFGLGPHPTAPEEKWAKEVVGSAINNLEESAGSLLNVLMAEILFGRDKAHAMGQFLGFNDYPDATNYKRSVLHLRKHSLLGPNLGDTLTLSLPEPLTAYLRANEHRSG